MTIPEPTPRILHQEDVEAVINKEIDESGAVIGGTAVIASPAADVASLKVAVDEIRAALTAAGVTA